MDMVFSLTRASDIEADPYLGVVNVVENWPSGFKS
jgi:hypothetical protein